MSGINSQGPARPDGWEDGEEPLTFYYNRERRIANAPQNVRDYYSGQGAMPRGFFKVLVATPGKRVLFFSILALCALIVFLTYSVPSASRGEVADIPAELSAFSFEETLYISLRLGPSKNAEPRTVRAEISVFNADGEVFDRQVMEKKYLGEEEFFRTKTGDYDIIRVEAVLSCGGQERSLKSSITRK
ncbi:MAG: hypothetical protein LBR23_02320 [Spirochaetaceae bacterium]|jgi:hypothetical protein|nr:hypothetical protein [Spirochaetaceae bacterium]